MKQNALRPLSLVFSVCLALWIGGPAAAQPGGDAALDIFPNLSLGDLGTTESEPAVLRASYSREGDNEAQGTLRVTAQMQRQWHVYSVTQAAGGPLPTKITLRGPEGVELLEPFKPDAPPKRSKHDAWPGLTIEEHYDKVTWSAPVRLPAGFDGSIELSVTALVCKTDGSCIPLNTKLTAAQSAAPRRTQSPAVETTTSEAPAAVDPVAEQPAATAPSEVAVVAKPSEQESVAPFRNDKSVVQWTGRLVPAQAAPGSRASLQITAIPDEGFHVYAAAVDDTESRTNFVITEKSGLKLGAPRAPTKPIVKTILPGLPPFQYHEGKITWSIPIEIGDDIGPGDKQIRGLIGYQACTDTSCMQPRAIAFTAQLQVSATPDTDAQRSVRFEAAGYAATMNAAAETQWVDRLSGPDPAERTETEGTRGEVGDEGAAPSDGAAAVVTRDAERDVQAAVPLSLLAILGLALVGGLILNLMPCVLPVVGLKIMSFASQAGQDRGKVLMLNAAYTLGILIVFWALAALAILSTYSWGREFLGIEGQLSWGQQFQFFGFRYGVILLVFAMALSFLGVWEIPLPGFVGGKSTQELQRQEGFSGAFFKGVFTTVLATPCSGPLLGAVFAYTLGKPAWMILAIFSAIGLGMALPYLLIAAFPRLIVFLPKPGEWMDTFKQLLGFLLLATVVFIFTFFPAEDMVLVFASLVGVWFGCWIIGRVPGWETLPKRLTAWFGGIGAAVAACLLAFWLTAPSPVVMAWEPYDEARLQQLQREGRTVLVDFTAKWCVNCIINYNVAINTKQTGQLISELNAVPMLADWSYHDDAIGAKLQELDSNAIPVLAIYPGADPGNPIVLRDLVTQGEVLSALRQAGPSVSPPQSRLAEHATYDRNL